MESKFAAIFRRANELYLWDDQGLIGRFWRWPDGSWFPVVLRDDLWKCYL
jgi:hypothetical protein